MGRRFPLPRLPPLQPQPQRGHVVGELARVPTLDQGADEGQELAEGCGGGAGAAGGHGVGRVGTSVEWLRVRAWVGT
jgi:hypothetical protein